MIKEGQQEDGRYCRYFTLGATEVDLHNRLRLSALMGFFQETTGDQCELFGSGWSTLWEKHGMCYVVIRVEIRMDRYPGTGETVRVDTWPDNKMRMIFDRYGEVYGVDGLRIGSIVSQWALLDVNTRHFVRPNPEIVTMPDTSTLKPPFLLTKDNIFADQDAGIREFAALRAPGFSDFDYNGHMNNARYAEWAVDALWQALTEDERATKPRIDRLDIKFRAEIPASMTGTPLKLTVKLQPEQKIFSLKGTDAAEDVDPACKADPDSAAPPKRATLRFECEGNYS